jgi:hypothetical protein
MEACRMSNGIRTSSNDAKPFKIGIAKHHEIRLNSGCFIPESSIKDIHLWSDVPEVLEMYQTKVEPAVFQKNIKNL